MQEKFVHICRRNSTKISWNYSYFTIRNVWSNIHFRIQSCCCLQCKGELSLYSNLTTVSLTKLSVCVCTIACSAFVMSRKPAKREGLPDQPSFHLTWTSARGNLLLLGAAKRNEAELGNEVTQRSHFLVE